MSSFTKNQFELLLPVGQKEMALAAIHNGADAIYIGVPGFNARGRSYDFQWEELNEIVQTCHLYGVKVNLAFNIVIFEEELPSVIETIHRIGEVKPDALIIQDLGLAQLVRRILPEQPIHASTQMTITNDLAMNLLEDLKIKRFVLGRENSLSEIKLIKEKTDKELEVFVHGALCVSYSGQCFTSESLGGRSANRGQCAQSCRFSYDLIVDGEKKNLVDKEYLVSPQDLCGIQEIPELMKIGVTSYKIEGRLKTPEYVASAAREFRNVINKTLEEAPLSARDFETAKRHMATQYSRGFFSGWLHGVDHQQLVNGTYSAHRGDLIGKVISSDLNSTILVELDKELALIPGDGLLWAQGEKEWGSFIYSVEKVRARIYRIGIAKEITLSADIFNALLYLNHDKELKSLLNKSFQDKNYFKRIPVSFHIELALNEKILARASDGKLSVELQTAEVTSPAQQRPLSDEMIQNEFSSLGGSVFSLENLNIHRADNKDLYIPAKELKNLRQNLIQELSLKRQQHRVEVADFASQDYTLEKHLNEDSESITTTKKSAPLKFNLLLRDKDQVSALIDSFNKQELLPTNFHCVILDFEFGRDYKTSIDGLKPFVKTGIAITRILKPQEYTNLKVIASLDPDCILVRNLGALQYFTQVVPFKGQLIGDFSLNVTNHLTAEYLLGKGLTSLCLSYDMNRLQVAEILKTAEAQKLEVTLHQYMPSFHMEHCVFAAFLSKGSSYKDCGKPCEKHFVQLKDQFNNYHWIKPDHECRNTMFNAKAQSALKFLDEWLNLGLGHVRYEALHEKNEELIANLKNYIQYFKSQQNLEETLAHLQANQNYGLSEGNLAREHKYQSRKKEFQF